MHFSFGFSYLKQHYPKRSGDLYWDYIGMGTSMAGHAVARPFLQLTTCPERVIDRY